MSIVNQMTSVEAGGRSDYEIVVDPALLRRIGHFPGHFDAVVELERVRATLMAQGMNDRSANRTISMVARHALLMQGKASTRGAAHWGVQVACLLRLHVVDRVPVDVLARLTWQQVRPHLCEIAMPSGDAPRYFELTQRTGQLLRQMRLLARAQGDPGLVFHRADGQEWDADALAYVIALVGRSGIE